MQKIIDHLVPLIARKYIEFIDGEYVGDAASMRVTAHRIADLIYKKVVELPMSIHGYKKGTEEAVATLMRMLNDPRTELTAEGVDIMNDICEEYCDAAIDRALNGLAIDDPITYH